MQKDEEEGYLPRVRTFGIDRFDELMIIDESFTIPLTLIQMNISTTVWE